LRPRCVPKRSGAPFFLIGDTQCLAS
jgi:hypothetical protein